MENWINTCVIIFMVVPPMAGLFWLIFRWFDDERVANLLFIAGILVFWFVSALAGLIELFRLVTQNCL